MKRNTLFCVSCIATVSNNSYSLSLHSATILTHTIACSHIQLFRERLSYKRRKAYATMPKDIMGNGGFYGSLSKPQVVSAW